MHTEGASMDVDERLNGCTGSGADSDTPSTVCGVSACSVITVITTV